MVRFYQDGVAPPTIPMTPVDFEKQDNTRIYWLGGAGFMVNARGMIIFIDPVLTLKSEEPNITEADEPIKIELPILSKNVPKADIVLCTHTDGDHMGLDTISSLAKKGASMLVGPPPVILAFAKRRIEPDLFDMCRDGDRIEFGGIKIDVMLADHPHQLIRPSVDPRVNRREDCVGYIVTTPDAKIYFPGDTRMTEAHLKTPPVDVFAMDCSVSSYHLSYGGSAVLANLLNPAILIPYHYGTWVLPHIDAFNGVPEEILERVEDGEKRYRKIGPGGFVTMINGKEVHCGLS